MLHRAYIAFYVWSGTFNIEIKVFPPTYCPQNGIGVVSVCLSRMAFPERVIKKDTEKASTFLIRLEALNILCRLANLYIPLLYKLRKE